MQSLARCVTNRGANVLNRLGKLQVSRSHVNNRAPFAFVARRTLCNVITAAIRRYNQSMKHNGIVLVVPLTHCDFQDTLSWL